MTRLGATLLLSATTIAALSGCAARPAAATAVPHATASILTSSIPAAGSTVSEPVDELKLHFDPPARLDEVILSGPGGDMPTMVHAIGEVADYSLPLAGLETGSYTVHWRASARGQAFQVSFEFTVK